MVMHIEIENLNNMVFEGKRLVDRNTPPALYLNTVLTE